MSILRSAIISGKETVEAYLNYREQLADSVRQRLLGIQPDLSVVRSRLLGKKILFTEPGL